MTARRSFVGRLCVSATFILGGVVIADEATHSIIPWRIR